ncbi:MAG: FmdE, Molybdenum formylmethanofuran dehydrogenase operon [Syntrophaceae bacterium PtaU1.Bin231]|nr:MAG: FmdE, Molybdenum formylmethanofuran dehydrogenase operon [Syntrophaceae bacterium PtaU1.Bin231]
MKIGNYSYEEYLRLIQSFHGNPAPGLIIGGFMVDVALKSLPEGEFFDAICETPVCLPDAVQLLTPCTIGNGWLTILNFGRFAITLYEKYGGAGVRVYLDTSKLARYPEIHAWYFKLKPKKEQDKEALMNQIREAGEKLFGIERVRVNPESLRRKKMGPVAVCSRCGEAYPARDGDCCKACQGESPYLESGTQGCA